MALPALRYVDVIPVEHEGQTLVCMTDPQGFADSQLVMSPLAFFIASQLDGETDVADIQLAFARQFDGQILAKDAIVQVVNQLDASGMLLSSRFLDLQRQVIETFMTAEVREPYLAGKSYPDDPAELRAFIEHQFTREGGPGEMPAGEAGKGAPPRCLIVPHIDLTRGGHCYAHGYLRMFQQGRPKTAFIFGVAHAGAPTPFCLTKKHFATPFGVLETDRALVKRLETACAWDPYEYEIVHRTEHSIEFQALMLAYLFGTETKIVPILCGSFVCEDDPDNTERAEAADTFLDACREIAAERDGSVCFIASADLAHVGQRFGDDFAISKRVAASVRARDEEDLAHAAVVDSKRWFASVMRDGNQRRVCGLNCIYSALRSVEGLARKAELLHYDFAPDPAGGIVSFASLVAP